MKKCVIFGAGYMGKNIDLDILKIRYELIAYSDNDEGKVGLQCNGYPVISRDKLLELCGQGVIHAIIVAILDIGARTAVTDSLRAEIKNDQVEIKDYFKVRQELVCEYLEGHHDYRDDSYAPKFQKNAYEWLENIKEEIKFHIEHVAKPDGDQHSKYIRWINNQDFLIDGQALKFDQDFEEKLKNGDKILDIGCGPVTYYGNFTREGKRVEIIPVDALAFCYNIVNEKYAAGKWESKRCKFGLFEFLDYFFDESSVDHIIINNALEHGIDPYKGLIKCLYILKCGGVIHMKHHRAEGLFEFWQGLHKWNIDYNQNDDFMLWNRENSINVTSHLKDLAQVDLIHSSESEENYQQPEIYINITKKRNFELDKYEIDNDKREFSRITEKLMEFYSKEMVKRVL